MQSILRKLLVAIAIVAGFVLVSPAVPAEEITIEKLVESYRSDLEKLLQQWERKGHKLDIFVWVPPSKNRQILYFYQYAVPLSKRMGANQMAVIPDEDELIATAYKLRLTYADKLFALATEEFNKPNPNSTFAFQTLNQVLRENPNHKEALKILDYWHPEKHWITQLGIPITTSVTTLDHPQLGWKRGKHWRYESPHFQLTTNKLDDKCRNVVEELEILYATWQQVFFEQLARPGALAARVKGGTEPLFGRSKQHRVVLFHSREEYLAFLGKAAPRIELTTGLYYDRSQTSYFYLSNEQDRLPVAARYHEIVHQLLQENIGGRFPLGEKANFWAVEGIATYFESLAFGPGYVTLGGWEADRLQFARYRTLSGDQSWPLSQLLPIGRDQWQQHDDIRQLYARSAGMTQFLLDGNQGKYRSAYLNLIGSIYRQQDKPDSLTTLTKVQSNELDEQFKSFLQVTDSDLDFLLQPQRLRNLSLGLTTITDAGLVQLKPCTKLEWLDLTRTNVSDEGLQVIAQMPQLKQLFLERTQGTTATLQLIGKLQNLEELDLTGWQLANDDLRFLAGLKKLEILYLTQTPIDDAALVHLKPLTKLKIVETTGTKITAAGRKKLGLTE